MSNLLSSMSVDGDSSELILTNQRSGHCGQACAELFRATHVGADTDGSGLKVPEPIMEGVGVHPNAWFVASNDYYSKAKGNEMGVKQKRSGAKKGSDNDIEFVDNENENAKKKIVGDSSSEEDDDW